MDEGREGIVRDIDEWHKIGNSNSAAPILESRRLSEVN